MQGSEKLSETKHIAGRKFRDEARPRAGLLRGREFLMKDLYTFDATEELAEATYNEARDAYNRIFSRIGLPYLVVSADFTFGHRKLSLAACLL